MTELLNLSQESACESSEASTPKITETTLAFLALALALVSISLSAIFIKLGERELSPLAIAFNRFWLTTVVLGLWMQFKGKPDPVFSDNLQESLSYSQGEWLQLLALGIFFVGDLAMWSWSLTQTSVAKATLLGNLTPIFTTLSGWLIFNKRVESRFLLGLIIAIAGTLALGFDDFSLGSGKLKGDLAALLGAVFFSIYIQVLEKLQTKLKVTTIIFWSSAIATVVILPIALLTGDTLSSLFPVSWSAWLSVIALALVCQILGQGILTYSLKRLSCAFVAIFLLLDPVLAAIGAWAIFGEQLSLGAWIAFALVLLGIYLALNSQSSLKTIEETSEEISHLILLEDITDKPRAVKLELARETVTSNQ